MLFRSGYTPYEFLQAGVDCSPLRFVAIQKAQEAYDTVNNDKNMWTLYELYRKPLDSWSPSYDQEKEAKYEAIVKHMETMGYQHYMDWFNSIRG